MPALADALAAWIKAMGRAPAALLGNSFGCQVIADLGARHPDLVERAVLQDPTAPPQNQGTRGLNCLISVSYKAHCR